MKTVFIIPGATESAENLAYPKIAGYFKKKNIRPLIVPIKWDYRVITDYIAQFDDFYNKNKTGEDIFFGFSLGAMIALISAAKYNPESLILCSLSPYFRQDLEFTTNVLGEKIIKRYIGVRRMKDFEKYDFDILASEIKSKTYILYGDKEGQAIERRIKDAQMKLKRCQLIQIENTKHDISQESYLEAVKELVNKEF